uniref:Uncharacterized protein n=1 Tax=Salix viminalis TaxID=40686 RepID=A0A6N2K0W3_SALVM
MHSLSDALSKSEPIIILPTLELSLLVKVLRVEAAEHTKLPLLAGIERFWDPTKPLRIPGPFPNPSKDRAHTQYRILLSVFMAQDSEMAIFFVLAIFFAVAMYIATVTAQDSEMAPAPAMDRGAACSDLGMSGAVFCSTLLLSLLALLKN